MRTVLILAVLWCAACGTGSAADAGASGGGSSAQGGGGAALGGGGAALGGGGAAQGGGGAALGTCADLSVPCGMLGSADASIDCGTCAFSRLKLGMPSYANVSMVKTSAGLVVAWFDTSQAHLARELADGGFAVSTVDDISSSSGAAISVAAASDGQVYVAYQSGFEIRLATAVAGGAPDGGEFVIDPVVTGVEPSVALDLNGAPHIAYQQTQFSAKSIREASRAPDGGWATSLVEYIDAGYLGMPKVLFDSAGVEHVLYIVDRSTAAGGLHHASAGAVEVIAPGGLGGSALGQLDAVFDQQGALHAVWPSYPFSLMYGRREAGTWQVRPVSDDNAGHENNALAVDGQGRAVVAFHNFQALKLSAFNGQSFSVQGVQPCDEGGVALSFDGQNRLRLASACGAMSVLTLDGRYPASHRADCEQLSSLVCAQACGACKASDGDCCLSTTGTTHCTNRCSASIGGLACFDATKPQSLFDQCLAAAGGLTCAMPSTDGVDVRGTACDELFAAP